jgi:hypothetical protein
MRQKLFISLFRRGRVVDTICSVITNARGDFAGFPLIYDQGLGSGFLFSTFILRNNSALTNLQSPLHAVFHVLRGPRPQDAGTYSLLLV